MAATALVDTGFLVALLNRRDIHHDWAITQAALHIAPWRTCEAVLSEAFHLVGTRGSAQLGAMVHRQMVVVAFSLPENLESVLTLMQKYAELPMSLADACLVRMTELVPDPVLLTTDADFRIYRRHSRQVVPCVLPR